jgi:small subunit ribosomal protein S6e
MKLNLAYPATGCMKMIEIDDENKLRAFYDKRMSTEVEGDHLGDDFKGYIFKISGGNDKQGFAMKQGVLTAARVRLLMSEGHSCFRTRRPGERKRKSVRGCVVSSELSVLNLVVVKKGPTEIPGLTDAIKPRRHAPKRASKIRQLFNLKRNKDGKWEDDVRQYNVKRRIAKEGQKAYFKKPTIQRLVTPQRLQRKRHEKHVRKVRQEANKKSAATYNDLIAARFKEQRDKRAAAVQKRRSASVKKPDAKPAAAAPAAKKADAPAKKAEAPKAAAPAPKAAAPAPKAAAPAKKAEPAKPAAKKGGKQ